MSSQQLLLEHAFRRTGLLTNLRCERFASARAAEMAVEIDGDGSNALRVATMVAAGLHCSRLTCIRHRSMHSFARLCSCCMLGRFFDEERTTCCVMLLMCGDGAAGICCTSGMLVAAAAALSAAVAALRTRKCWHTGSCE